MRCLPPPGDGEGTEAARDFDGDGTAVRWGGSPTCRDAGCCRKASVEASLRQHFIIRPMFPPNATVVIPLLFSLELFIFLPLFFSVLFIIIDSCQNGKKEKENLPILLPQF